MSGRPLPSLDHDATVDGDLAAFIVDSIGDAIFCHSGDGVILSWNRGAEGLFGYCAAEVIGRSISCLCPRNCLQEDLERISRQPPGTTSTAFEAHRVRKDGTEVVVETTLSALLDSQGELLAIAHVERDITTERHIRLRQIAASTMVDQSDDAIVTTLPDGTIVGWNRSATRIFGYGSEEMIGQSILRLSPSERRNGEAERFALPCAGEAVSHFETRRMRKDGSIIDIAVSLFPILASNGQIVAVTKVVRDITESKRVQARLAEVTADLGQILEHSPMMVSHWNPDRTNRYANRAYAASYGMTPEEMRGRHVADVLGPDLYPRIAMRFDAAQAGARQSFDRTFPMAGGRVRHEIVDYVPDARLGAERGLFVFVYDITSRKQAEYALRDSEARFRKLFEDAPIGMALVAIDGSRILDANRRLCQFLGFPLEELRGKSVHDISHPDDLPLSTDGLHLIEKRKSHSYTVEKRYRRSDGTYVWGKVTASVVGGDDDPARYLVVQIEDIERRRAAEVELRDAQDRLSMALEATELSIFDMDVETGSVMLDERWAAMMDLPPGATLSTAEELARQTHPDDMPRAMAAALSALKGNAPAYEQESRVRTGTGGWKWIRSCGKVVERDANGRAIRLIGTNLDVSARKEIEERIRKMAFFDSLTGLPNRALFLDRLQQAVAVAHRDKAQMAVLYLDLDRFKKINDSKGHEVGDDVLRVIARRFQTVVRESDTLGRLGGDEFGIVAPNADRTEACAIAQRIRDCLDEEVTVAGGSFGLGVSVGMAIHPENGNSPDHLLRIADTAMYSVKQQRNAAS